MKDEFNKNSLIVLSFTTTASAINYLSQIILGRTMSLESFGIINTIFSLILVASVPGSTLNILAAKIVGENPEKNKVINLLFIMIRYIFFTSLIYFLLSIILRPTISLVLGAENNLILYITLLVVCVSFLQFVFSGILSGLKIFFVVGFLSLIMPLCKSLGVIGTSFMGNEEQKIIIVLLFILIGYILTAFVGQYFLRINDVSLKFGKEKESAYNNLGKAGVIILIVNILYMFLYNFDLLSINTIFGTTISGLYSSTMLFGKIIFYFVTSIVTVMLPFVASEKAKNGYPILFLKKTLFYTIILSFLFFLPLNFAPKFFLSLIYGEKYIEAAIYIPFISILSVITSMLYITINYLIGTDNLKFLLKTLLIGVISGIAILFLWHENIEQVLLCIIANLGVIVIINIRKCLLSNHNTFSYK